MLGVISVKRFAFYVKPRIAQITRMRWWTVFRTRRALLTLSVLRVTFCVSRCGQKRTQITNKHSLQLASQKPKFALFAIRVRKKSVSSSCFCYGNNISVNLLNLCSFFVLRDHPLLSAIRGSFFCSPRLTQNVTRLT